MKKRTIFLIALVIFFPLNNLPSYASDASPEDAMAGISSPYLFTPDNISEKLSGSVVGCFLDGFSAVSAEAMKYALTGYAALNEAGKILQKDIITIVDFSKPSTQERLFVINLKTKSIIAKSLCAHGRNSGEIFAEKFSNNPESYQSSLGFFIANETYDGKHGYSLRLDGEEAGINDKARDRGVVVHGADYVSKSFINSTGRLGRSQGCPALPMDMYQKIISLIKGGSCFFIYHPNNYYRTHSPILKHYSESCLAEVVSGLGDR